MIRGHDHLEARYAYFENYRSNPVLTINTMCYRQEGEMFGEFHRAAIVAKWESHQLLPVVHKIHIPPAVINRVYGDAV
jgi:hypothetical protein